MMVHWWHLFVQYKSFRMIILRGTYPGGQALQRVDKHFFYILVFKNIIIGFIVLKMAIWDSHKWGVYRDICKKIPENQFFDAFHGSDQVIWVWWILELYKKNFVNPKKFYICQVWPEGAFFIDYSSRVLVL